MADLPKIDSAGLRLAAAEGRKRVSSVARVSKEQQMSAAEIRPNPGAKLGPSGRCEDTDEVVGSGFLHVEQMDKNCYWARLDLPDGRAIVMWFNSRSPIKLTAEWD